MERTKMSNLRNGSKGGFEPGLTWFRVRRSTAELPRSTSSITNQLLADWSRGRASCALSRRSTRLQAAADCSSGKTAWHTCQPPSKWDWIWPSLCRMDLERTGSVGELLTVCTQGWAVRKQWWGDGAISTTPSPWIATAGSHRRWPTSSHAVY